MAFDYKKEYKEYYMPQKTPALVDIPPMRYAAVYGSGDPNEEGGEYKRSIGMLYAAAFGIKMSKLTDRRIEGYFDFVVPPLEGFWSIGEGGVFDFAHKERLRFISAIRMPDFVTQEFFYDVVRETGRKKGVDLSPLKFITVDEGRCVQCMHIGPYDGEPGTIERMRVFAGERGFKFDRGGERLHHEIYLSDPRRCAPERLKTVLREPVAPSKSKET